MKNLPEKYQAIWQKCLPLFEQARPGDKKHALEVIAMIEDYDGDVKINKDVLIPAAMMHDIGHAAILSEHFDFISGGKKLKNAKLVHMLAGAKIAHDILSKVGYDQELSKEIVEIIAWHDADQLEGVDYRELFDTKHKKFFHDMDAMDRFTEERIASFAGKFDSRDQIFVLLTENLDTFFYPDLRHKAEERLTSLK